MIRQKTNNIGYSKISCSYLLFLSLQSASKLLKFWWDGGRPHSCYLDIRLQTVGNLVSTKGHLYICDIILRLYNTVGQVCGLSRKLLCLSLHVLDPDWRILQNKCFPLLLEFIHQLCFYRETRAQIVCETLTLLRALI